MAPTEKRTRRRTDEKKRLTISVHPPIHTGLEQVADLMGITLSRAAEYMLIDGLEALGKREGFRVDLSFPTRARLRLHPPDWLVGDWEEGSPGDAQMRVDEDGVAINLADWSIEYPEPGKRNFMIATPIHVNRTEVSTDSVEGQTYRLQAVSGKRYEATLQQDGSVQVVVDDFAMSFPASGRRQPR